MKVLHVQLDHLLLRFQRTIPIYLKTSTIKVESHSIQRLYQFLSKAISIA